MLETSQGSVERDGLYVANKVILKVLCVIRPVTALRLTHPLFWL